MEFESNLTGLKSLSSPDSAPPGAHIFGPSRKDKSSTADLPPVISSLLDHFAKIMIDSFYYIYVSPYIYLTI